MLGAFKLDHSQPVEPILSLKFYNIFTFIPITPVVHRKQKKLRFPKLRGCIKIVASVRFSPFLSRAEIPQIFLPLAGYEFDQ